MTINHPIVTEDAPSATDDKHGILVGVSSCLLGNEVRYDGGHKRDAYVVGMLGRHFRFVPICPEMDIGLGVPRETLRLVRRGGETRLIASATGTDHTEAMRAYAHTRAREIGRLGVRGYILKKNSPSCGMTRVKTYTPAGMPAPSDRGLFAEALMAFLPVLPVEEEGRLNDSRLRENFIVRVFAYDRVTRLFTGRWRMAHLVAFQAKEKMLLMAHDADAQRELGRIVARAKSEDRAAVRDRYVEAFMRALSRPASTRRHVNVLQHMVGYLRDHLGRPERLQIAESIEDYRNAAVPLIVPLTLIKHYVTLLDVSYLRGQTYLQPHPKELALRNHV